MMNKWLRRILLAFTFLLFYSTVFADEFNTVPTRKKFYIQSARNYGRDNGGFWDIPGRNVTYKEGQNLKVWDLSDRDADRRYAFYQIPNMPYDDAYFIMPEHGLARGGRIAVRNNERRNGANVQLSGFTGNGATYFRFKHQGNGRWKIYNVNGQALCLAGRSSANGSNIHMWDDHDGPWMEWILIDAQTNKPYNPDIRPAGRVTDAQTGAPIPNARVTLYRGNISHYEPHKVTTNSNGEFAFGEIPGLKYGYFIIASAPGYGTQRINLHTTYGQQKSDFGLKKKGEHEWLVKTTNLGDWLYYESYQQYYNKEGVVTRRGDYFFPEAGYNTPKVNWLKQQMQLGTGTPKTDLEIYSALKKVWTFWCNHSVSAFNKKTAPANALQGREYLYKIPPGRKKRWPTPTEYATVLADYGCIPRMNCSSNAIAFANLLSLAGIAPSKVAIEKMHSFSTPNVEHWAVVVKMKRTWYWFDPGMVSTPFPSFEALHSIPQYPVALGYKLPFEIIQFPGAGALNKVPYCGSEGTLP